MEAAKRSNVALADGDQGGYEFWQQIMSAITEMQRGQPLPGEAIH
jgi:hypothetical protein